MDKIGDAVLYLIIILCIASFIFYAFIFAPKSPHFNESGADQCIRICGDAGVKSYDINHPCVCHSK
jgi:hypothetical protein